MEISVCEATPEEAAELKVKTGTPCLLMEEIVYDQYDKPFHRTKSVLRGDKFKYINPIPVNQTIGKENADAKLYVAIPIRKPESKKIPRFSNFFLTFFSNFITSLHVF